VCKRKVDLRHPISRRKGEAGQATLLVFLGFSIFLIGALGLAIDGSTLYAQRQMAQSAADSAAQAAIRSISTGSNTATGNTHAFSTTAAFTCSSGDARTPCYFAQTLNGFNGSGDIVSVDFPTAGTVGVPSASLSPSDPVNLLRVNVRRRVNTALLSFVGISSSTVGASATGAIVNVSSPVPIIITHPTMAGALDMNGNTSITISGGPTTSIQVNSNGTNPSGSAFNPPSSGNVDLSAAGPNGTGANFANFGGPTSTPGSLLVGSTGHYVDPAYPIQDPLAGVPAPSVPTATPPANGQSCSTLGHCGSCPASGFSGTAPSTCTEFLPGAYSSINIKNVSSAFFDPGVYYIKGGGFTLKNSTVGMCTTCAADATTVNGMVIYDAGATTTSTATGGFTIDTNTSAELVGAGVSTGNPTAAPASPYYGILFFEQRNADAQTHTLGQGNGCFSIIETIYITNTLAIMSANPSHYQGVMYHGTPCTGVSNVGEIIVSQLTLKGTAGINMQLFPTPYLNVRQIGLVQ